MIGTSAGFRALVPNVSETLLADLSAQALGEFLDLLQLFDHIFGQHAFLNAGDVVRYGLGYPGKVVRILAEPGEVDVRSLGHRGRQALVRLLLGLFGLFQSWWPWPCL